MFGKFKKRNMMVYGFDNFEGDKGIIIAENYDSAVRIYGKRYDRKITDDYYEYTSGGCYLAELGVVENRMIYVNAEW